MGPTRLMQLVATVGLVVATTACSGSTEVNSTGGPDGPGATGARVAGTVIVAERAGAEAAESVAGLIGPPPTSATTIPPDAPAPATTTATTIAPPSEPAPEASTPPVAAGISPVVSTPPPRPTVTFTVPAPTVPATAPVTFPPRPTQPPKPAPEAIDPAALSSDEQIVLATLNSARGEPLVVELYATQTASKASAIMASTKDPFPLPAPLFDHVNANFVLLTSGLFSAADAKLLGNSAVQRFAGSGLDTFSYVGLSTVRIDKVLYGTIILGA